MNFSELFTLEFYYPGTHRIVANYFRQLIIACIAGCIHVRLKDILLCCLNKRFLILNISHLHLK